MPRRLTELDAVRGLAAVGVLLHHSLVLFPAWLDDTRADGLTALNVVKYSPLHAPVAGTQFVVLFFVLSGLVLTLPFAEGRAPRYLEFVVRRWCRIVLPLLAAALVVMAAAWGVGPVQVAGLSEWINGTWSTPPTLGALGDHALLVGRFDHQAFDPVLWSLVHEMRVSLVFPLLAMIVLAGGTRAAIVAACGLSLIGAHTTRASDDWAATLLHLPCFVAGISLALERQRALAWVRARRGPALAVGALLLFTWPWLRPEGLLDPGSTRALDVWAPTAAAALVLLAAHDRAFLRAAVPQWLGRVSYSLYLIHAVVLIALIRSLHGLVPLPALLPLCWAAALAAAAVLHRYVEAPAAALRPRVRTALRPAGRR